jgi:hypothetical protein
MVRSPAGRDELPDEVARSLPANGIRQTAASALQKLGDQVVNARTVLPWLLLTLAAPVAFVGFLVPLREAGSMLPQAALAPWVRGLRRRKVGWVLGAAGQAVFVAAMALVGVLASGVVAGLLIVLSLAGFAVARSLCSLAGKDVLGRTIPKGERGQIQGVATMASGVVAIAIGLVVRALGGAGRDLAVLVGMLIVGVVAWIVAAAVYATIREPAGEVAPEEERARWWRDSVDLLASDPAFRRFVLVRGLLLVSALSPPFVVALAADRTDAGLAGLGLFVVASGVAAILGGRLFGPAADRSSRQLMAFGAAAASLVVVVFLVLLNVPAVRDQEALYLAVYLVLTVVHTGVRLGRKTFVVDLAEGDRRTEYVAVSNTAMGVLLLAVGALTSALAVLGAPVALAVGAARGRVGGVVARTQPAGFAGGRA